MKIKSTAQDAFDYIKDLRETTRGNNSNFISADMFLQKARSVTKRLGVPYYHNIATQESFALRSDKDIQLLHEQIAIAYAIGDMAITDSFENLPLGTDALIEKWKSNDNPEQQIEILFELNKSLRSLRQGIHAEVLTMEKLFYKTLTEHHERIITQGHFDTPYTSGVFTPESLHQCQGKNHLIMAFAQHLGIPVVECAPSGYVQDIFDEYRYKVNEAISESWNTSKLLSIDKDFKDSTTAFLYQAALNKRSDYSFHTFSALQISDGRWVIMDPNCNIFSVLSVDSSASQAMNAAYKYNTKNNWYYYDDTHVITKNLERMYESAQEYLELNKQLDPLAEHQNNSLSLFLEFVKVPAGQKLIEGLYPELAEVSEPEIKSYIILNELSRMFYEVDIDGVPEIVLKSVLERDFTKSNEIAGSLLTIGQYLAVNQFTKEKYFENGTLYNCKGVATSQTKLVAGLSIVNSYGAHSDNDVCEDIFDAGICMTNFCNILESDNYSIEAKKVVRDFLYQLPIEMIHTTIRQKMNIKQ